MGTLAVAARDRLNQAEDEAWDAISGAEAYAATQDARSIPGALVHACLLADQIENLSTCVMEDEDRQEALRKAKRLVLSIGAVLRAHAAGMDPLSQFHFTTADLEAATKIAG